MRIQIRILILSLLAVLAVSAVASASASAAFKCYKVAVAGSGAWENSTCTVVGTTKEYVKAELIMPIGLNEYCAKAEAGEPSTYEDNECTKAKTGGGYIKVSAPEAANCYKVAVIGTGNYDSSCVTNAGPTKNEYVKARLVRLLYDDVWCAEVAAGSGHFTDNKCENSGAGNYSLVKTRSFFVCKNVGAGNGKYKTNECKEEGGAKEWARIEPEGSETVPVEGTSKASILKGTILGVTIEIECEKDAFSSSLEGGGKSGAGSISFKKCKLTTAESKCKLTSSDETEIPTTFDEDQLEEMSGRFIDRFEPVGATNTFATITIEKVGSETCVIEGPYKVKGSQYCEEDKTNAEAETFATEHELICKESGSELYIGSPSNPASFTSTAKVKLTGGGYWAIQ